MLAGASDGGAHTKNFSGGQWITDLILWLVRDNDFFSLEEMHYRLSYQPARAMGIKDRGALLEGMAADILLYDLDELYFDQDRFDIVHDQPGGDWRRKARAGGYRQIFVNGEQTFERDRLLGTTPRRLSRRQRAAPADRPRGLIASVLRDKVILVVGGSTGIGRATAIACGQAGATVVVGARDRASRAEEVAGRAARAGWRRARSACPSTFEHRSRWTPSSRRPRTASAASTGR